MGDDASRILTLEIDPEPEPAEAAALHEAVRRVIEEEAPFTTPGSAAGRWRAAAAAEAVEGLPRRP